MHRYYNIFIYTTLIAFSALSWLGIFVFSTYLVNLVLHNIFGG